MHLRCYAQGCQPQGFTGAKRCVHIYVNIIIYEHYFFIIIIYHCPTKVVASGFKFSCDSKQIRIFYAPKLIV